MPNFLFADASYFIPVNLIIWSICIGANLGFLYNYLSKNVIGKLVRLLLDNASNEESAKTLKELGYKKFTLFYKVILKESSYLRRIISVAGGTIPQAQNENGVDTLDWENARFYIKEENQPKARSAYGNKQKWIFLPIFIVASILLSFAMTYIMPILIEGLPLI